MELVDVAAVVHHFARDNEFVLVVHDSLHIVARNTLTALDQKPGVRIGQGQLRLAAKCRCSAASDLAYFPAKATPSGCGCAIKLL
jgi:hypothetical protein